jgi:hypothetical protein
MVTKCPLTLLMDKDGTDCIEFKCQWWIGINGKDKNTGEEGIQYGCCVPFFVKGQLEQAYSNVGVAASIDKLATEFAKPSLPLVTIANALASAHNRQLEINKNVDGKG